MLNKKLSTSVKTPSMRTAKAGVLAGCPSSKKRKKKIKTKIQLCASYSFVAIPKAFAELKSENKGGIRSSHKNKHLHSFLKVKDKVIFPWLSLKLWSSQPTIKMFLLSGFSLQQKQPPFKHILPLYTRYHNTLNSPLSFYFHRLKRDKAPPLFLVDANVKCSSDRYKSIFNTDLGFTTLWHEDTRK